MQYYTSSYFCTEIGTLFCLLIHSWYLWGCSAEKDIQVSIGGESDNEHVDSDTGIEELPSPEPENAQPTTEPDVQEPEDSDQEDTGAEDIQGQVWSSIPDSLVELREGVHKVLGDDGHHVYATIPSSHADGEMLPLVVLLHDESGCSTLEPAQELAKEMLGQIAAAVVYPQMSGCSWTGLPEDVEFVRDVMLLWSSHAEVNEAHVYLIGQDEGGALALRVGVESTTLSGLGILRTSAQEQWEIPQDHRQHSFVQLVNARDESVPFSGGNGIMAVPESVLLWVEHNGCGYAPVSSSIGGVSLKEYPQCVAESRVFLGTVLPDPWHEECQSAWQEAQQTGTEMIPPDGIACGDRHELPSTAFLNGSWSFVWSLLNGN